MSHTLAEDFATVRKCIVNDPNEPRWITARAALDAIEQRMGELERDNERLDPMTEYAEDMGAPAEPSAGPWKLTGPWRSGDPERGGFVHRFYAERASPRQKVCLGEDYELAHQIVDGINGVSRSTAPKEGL